MLSNYIVQKVIRSRW